MKAKRKQLTDAEWNAISKLTSHTKLDQVFDVYQKRNGDDGFKDFEENKIVSLSKGLMWLYDGLAYPLQHDGLTYEEAKLIVDLFIEFRTTDDDLTWLLSEEEE